MSTTKSPLVLRVSSKDPNTMSVSALIRSARNLLVASILGVRVQRALEHSAFDMAEDYHVAVPSLIRAFHANGYDVAWRDYMRGWAIAWLELSPSKRMWTAMFDKKDDSLPGRCTKGFPMSMSDDDFYVLESIARDLAERSDSLVRLAYLHEAQILMVRLQRLKNETDGAVEYGSQPPMGGAYDEAMCEVDNVLSTHMPQFDRCSITLRDLLYLTVLDGGMPDWAIDVIRASASKCGYEARRILETLCSRVEDLADAQAKSAP